jgi:hypothetical protein
MDLFLWLKGGTTTTYSENQELQPVKDLSVCSRAMAPTTRPGLGEDLPTVSTLGASQHLLLSCHFFTHHRDPIVVYLVVKRCSARVEALSACFGLTLNKWACHKPNSSFVSWRLHGYCHTHEGFGHALLVAGEPVNSTFVEHPGKRTGAVRRLQISTKEQQVCVNS